MGKRVDYIIDQLNKGNSLVFKQLFREYYPAIRSFAYTYTQDDELSDDLTQDAFMKLWERREQFDNSAVLKSYLYTTVKNSAFNHYRHENIHDKHKEKIKYLKDESVFIDNVLEEEVHHEIHNALKDLSPQAYKVISLSMSGHSNPEIAEKLNISINTVKTIKQRAYKTLRKKLKGIYWILFLMMT